MDIEERIGALARLGEKLSAIDSDGLASLADKAAGENPWFTKDNVELALTGIRHMLDAASLRSWVRAYGLPNPAETPRTVALVLAGNIPLVGFHDLLCVLISGHKAMIKASSKDSVLMHFMANELLSLEPRFGGRITFVPQLKNFDAVIATGSDNSSRYFEQYFGKYPHIIRKNRTSCAVLDGSEQPDELGLLGRDVFSYFGLGCRNVSKLYVPEGYNFPLLLDQWHTFSPVVNHHKYCNNYDYQKAIMLINKVPFLDTGYVMVTENEKLVSPISVLYYEYYSTRAELETKLARDNDKIQCLVGKMLPAAIPFGQAQLPAVTDYADGIDVLQWLNVCD